jgi:hypothetical protein
MSDRRKRKCWSQSVGVYGSSQPRGAIPERKAGDDLNFDEEERKSAGCWSGENVGIAQE